MKKLIWMALFLVTFCALEATPASALVNDTVKVGLRYGSSAMASANLENAVGSGYEFGYYDEARNFVSLGRTGETKITMSPGAASLSGDHSMRGVTDYAKAPGRLTERYAAGGIVVTRTGSPEVLFRFDTSGGRALGVRPIGDRTETWFRGYKYAGGFEYVRASAGSLHVINVLNVEDYVKGVVPWEMPGDWPLAALEAQAVCARTFVLGHNKHLRTDGFDVCSGVDCQLYNGRGTNSAGPTETSDQAVENTAGQCIYYQGELVQDAVYHASDGGATEDGSRVWGTDTGYLKGKLDPYEARTEVPNNSYSVTYTASELSWILDQKGYSVGTVRDAYVSEYTPLGNVSKVTFVGSNGTKTVSGETCRTIFYSSTYKKSVSSMRFDINGGGRGSTALATTSGTLAGLDGAQAISAGGALSALWGNTATVMTDGGPVEVTASAPAPAPSGGSHDAFVITGTGNGHNVGMSQYGAKAMAEQGFDYQDILTFYYTDIDIR